MYRSHHRAPLLTAAALVFAAANAHASSIELPLGQTVDGIGPLHTGDFINNYYSGGFGSTTNGGALNVGPGPSVGFQFSSNANVQAAGHSAATGDGKFENNPSGLSQILYFAFTSPGITDTMNFSNGFTGASFNYAFSDNSSTYFGQTADVWSGINGTGSLLETLTLTGTATSGSGCTSTLDAYCTWYNVSTGALPSAAESITFGASNGNAQFTEFDGVTLQAQAVPLPAAGVLLMSGLGALGGLVRRRRVPAGG